MRMRVLVVIGVLGCSDKSGGKTSAPPTPPPPPVDTCVTAVDKVFAFLAKKGYTPQQEERDGAIAACKKTPDDPVVACVVKAPDDAALEACMAPKPKGEPSDQLDEMTQNLRTYFFVHETFTDQKIGPIPAQPCCSYPSKKCPPETAPDSYLKDILKLDLTTERNFQYRFESTGSKAVIEAIGDLDCDGTMVTYRRELERRDDGNMHITVDNPPPGSD